MQLGLRFTRNIWVTLGMLTIAQSKFQHPITYMYMIPANFFNL